MIGYLDYNSKVWQTLCPRKVLVPVLKHRNFCINGSKFLQCV